MLKKLAATSALSLAALALAAAPTLAEQGVHSLPRPVVSEELTLTSKSVEVLGDRMSYLEEGSGETVLFIHGNPTSSYLWRNIIPYVADDHRAIAVDLIGMGNSAKPDIAYTFADHARYLEAFVEALELTNITLVGHDWGAALAWDYARRHPDRVARLAFMEGVAPPTFPMASYEAMGEEFGGMFRTIRDPELGHQMIMVENQFVTGILPQLISRPLGEAATATYGAPYVAQEARLPTWVWPRELPIGGEPAANVTLMEDIQAYMGETEMPVLLAYADPGAIIPPAAAPFYTGLISNVETAFVGQGLHFIQEDQPDAIGRALDDWLRRN